MKAVDLLQRKTYIQVKLFIYLGIYRISDEKLLGNVYKAPSK